jgi:hypothetical protein
MTSEVAYDIPERIDPHELAAFYQRQKHQTTHSLEKLERMIANTYCLVTARRAGSLIGIARGVSDGVRGQLVECKLDPSCQGPACVTKTDGRIEHDTEGIAREMARRVIDSLLESGVERINVLAYGTEVDFCEELGFKRDTGLVPLHLDAQLLAAAGRAVNAVAS